MAGSADCAQLAVMVVILLVAGVAVRGCALVDVVDMAARTGHAEVCPVQMEGGLVVIEMGRFPGIGGVAVTTGNAQAAVVIIILLVAGIAVSGGTFEDIVGMTAQAIDRDVFAGQLEGGSFVVEGGRFPAIGGVA
jgi:hypothetical protein